MKRTFTTLTVLAALGLLSPTWAHADDAAEDAQDEAVIGANDEDWAYDSTEFAAFEDDDIVEDDYGYYDSDFDWDVDDDDWNSWYEADPGVWEDDADDEGFWDW